MGVLETLLGFSIIVWGLVFIYFLWIHDQIKKLDETVRKLEEKE